MQWNYVSSAGLDYFRAWLSRLFRPLSVWSGFWGAVLNPTSLCLFCSKTYSKHRFHVDHSVLSEHMSLSWVKRLRWFELVKGWDWDDARYSGAYHQRRYSVQWCVSVWVWLERSLYSSAVWDSCFSYRLRTWCTNWYCSHVWIIPPLRNTQRKTPMMRLVQTEIS